MKIVFSSRTQMLSFLGGVLLSMLGLAGIARLVYDATDWNPNVLLMVAVLISLLAGFSALAKSQLSDLVAESLLWSRQIDAERRAKSLKKQRQAEMDDAQQNQVYFIVDQANNAVKIGVSRNPSKRLSGLQSATHLKLSLLAVMPGGYQLEEELHRRFANDRINGEWFRFSDEIKQYTAVGG